MLHRDVAKMKREISLRYSAKMGAAGATYDVVHATPLGCAIVELLFAAFAVYDERSFARLCRRDRHNLWAVMAQHGCGMRFGHFVYRSYRLSSFLRNGQGDYNLVTDWHRYPGRRRYTLKFARRPRWNCLRYSVRKQDGSIAVELTAAKVFDWHFRALRRDGETKVFQPVAGQRPTRAGRQRWLREVLRAAIPRDETDALAMLADVTPHAWRAGLAGDMAEEQVSWQTIATWCRWSSMRAMRMYASRSSLHASRRSRHFRMISRHR